MESSIWDMTADLENSDGSKHFLQQYQMCLAKENVRLTELLEEEAQARRTAQAALTDGQGFGQGVEFPPFSDYQETFSAPLAAANFTMFIVPIWVPTPSQLTCMSRVIYPYWCKRCTERGHRIIPILNVSYSWSRLVRLTKFFLPFKETDTRNESYMCF